MILSQPETPLYLSDEELADYRITSNDYKLAATVWAEAERSRRCELGKFPIDDIGLFDELTIQERFDVMKLVVMTQIVLNK